MAAAEAILDQTVEQLETMNAARIGLPHELLRRQPRKFAILAERPLEGILRLCDEIKHLKGTLVAGALLPRNWGDAGDRAASPYCFPYCFPLPQNEPQGTVPAAMSIQESKNLVRAALALAALLLNASVSSPAQAGSFTSTSPLAHARYNHTATLLPNGKVLVAGGLASNVSYYSAELYDPITATWTPTGPLANKRNEHTATLLPSGKVLVVGGYGGGQSLGSVELYDPATGSWTTQNPLATPRSRHTATLLRNGKLLIAGGLSGTNNISSVVLYDPITGVWRPTGSLNTRRSQHTATLLPDGKVLVVGGYSSYFPWEGDYIIYYLSSAELYDPASEQWTEVGSLSTGRFRHTASLLPNGKVLAAGGYNFDVAGSILSSTELYDPATSAWTRTGTLTTERGWHTATLLPDGKVLVTGDYSFDFVPPTTSTELYDPTTGLWTASAAMADGRGKHTATLLHNGKVLVAGGYGYSYDFGLAGAELYDPSAGGWSEPTGALNSWRSGATATLLPDGKVLAAGGYDFDGWSGAYLYFAAEVYDELSQDWALAGGQPIERYSHTSTLLPSGKVLVAGGVRVQGWGTVNYLPNALQYDPTNATWTPAGALVTPRTKHTATLLTNGKVLVAGGQWKQRLLDH